jgi:hypothetical protein
MSMKTILNYTLMFLMLFTCISVQAQEEENKKITREVRDLPEFTSIIYSLPFTGRTTGC